MQGADETLRFWGWIFLAFYIAVMLTCGWIGMRRVRGGDDFATARSSYGPWFLSFAMVATTASGGTFIGLPGITYQAGLSGLWHAFVYPLGVYLGVLMCLGVVRRAGQMFRNRSIPEYLGDRFESDFLRIATSIFSLLLLFYLAAQLLSGAVMFQQMMGIPVFYALVFTSAILIFYIATGGAHADILTDGVQGGLMLLIAAGVTVMFVTGFGVAGGFDGMLERLNELDPTNTTVLKPGMAIIDSYWDVVAIFFAHAPLGMLPHIGNKLWALRRDEDRRRFITLSFGFGLFLPTLGLGGILARAVLGDALFLEGSNPNQAIPALFIALLPAWLAAFLGAGVLAAVMSTADGLLVSTSQIFANDLFLRTFSKRWFPSASGEQLDRLALWIGRVATVVVLVFAMWLAWEAQTMNVALLLWAGVGGMMAATAGPLMLGAVWRRLTKPAAIAGFFTGGISFIVLKAGWLPPVGPVLGWLASQEPNPYACATLGEAVSVFTCVAVSLFTKPPEPAHVARIFGDAAPSRGA